MQQQQQQACSFHEMLKSDLPAVNTSATPLTEEIGARRLLERLKRLRDPRRLPNLRVCQVIGSKVCLRSCDPFGLDAEGVTELLELGLRTIIDLRAEHERNEGEEAPLYSHIQVLRWQSDTGGFIEETLGNSAADAAETAAITVYRVDCLRSPQPQLRKFLSDYSGPSRLQSVPDVTAYILPVAGHRPVARLLRDVLDCFPDALAAAFRVLAQPEAYPVMLASRDGQGAAAVVTCLLQLALGEDPSIAADMHAASEVEYHRSQNPALSLEEQDTYVKESRKTMLGFIDHIHSSYRSADNYLLKAGVSQQEIRQMKTA